MNPLHQSPADPRDREQHPGDLDQMLRAYFQAEMPHPWPALKPPAEPSNALIRLPAQRRSLFRSRFVLAASVLLLLLGHLTLSGMFSDFVPTRANRSPGKEIGTNPHGPSKVKTPNSAVQPPDQK